MPYSDPLVNAFALLANYDGELPKDGDPLLFLVTYALENGFGGGATVPDDYFFSDPAARDAYFVSHPEELKKDVICCTESPVALWKWDETEWKDSSTWIRGPKGDSVELRVDSGYIQWKSTADSDWQNIIALSALQGAPGDSVELRVQGDYIQWKRTTDVSWQNLISLSLLKGADGSSVAWKGSFSSPPANPQTNWAYYDTVQGRSYIWDGSSWNIMSQDGTVIGGVPEAPDDGKSYVRKSKLWSEMPTPVVDYDDLTDKPAIDGTTLTKDSTAAGLGLETAANAGNNADLETTAKTTKVAAINELADGKLDKKTIYPDTSWEWFKPEVDGGGHWYWDFSTSTLRFEGFNNDSGSAVVWERYSISGGGPNFQLSGGSRIGARLIVAWDGGARGAGTLRTYYTTGRADSSFTAEDEIASQQWVRTLIAGEAGKPLPAVADHAALLALTGMKVNDWVYVEDDTPVHAGETWAYAYDGTNWVELVRINEVQVQDDDITLEIDSVSGKRQVKAGGIGTTQLASGAATDNVIGNRQVEDNPASDTLPEADTGFTLGQWLQKIRDNIKFALSKFIAKVDGVEPDSSRNVSVMRRITADEAQALIDDPTQAEPGVKYYVPETGDLLGEGIDWDSGVAVDMGTPPSVTDKEWLSNEYTANELCYIRTVTYGSSTAGNFCIWYVINGSQMLIDGNELLNTIGFYTRTIKLSKGDKLRIIIQRDGSSVANSLHIIRFLPIKLKPKFTAIKNPTLVVEEGSDYSYDEQPVMIRLPDGTVRQKTWVDGKPIWRITVSSPWIPTTVNSNYNLWIMSGVARVISAQNSILDTLGEYIVGDSFDRYDTSKIYRIVVHSTADSNLYLQMIQFDFFTQIQVENVYSTIEYTKG